MLFHHKELAYTVRVDKPNPVFARMLQQAIGGPEGEMRVMLQYLFQAWGCRGPKKYGSPVDLGVKLGPPDPVGPGTHCWLGSHLLLVAEAGRCERSSPAGHGRPAESAWMILRNFGTGR